MSKEVATALSAAGYEALVDLEGTTADELQEVEGVGPATATAILEWRASQVAAPDVSETAEEEAPAAATPSLDDDEFMAALSKALKESEMPQDEPPAESAEDTTSPDAEGA